MSKVSTNCGLNVLLCKYILFSYFYNGISDRKRKFFFKISFDPLPRYLPYLYNEGYCPVSIYFFKANNLKATMETKTIYEVRSVNIKDTKKVLFEDNNQNTVSVVVLISLLLTSNRFHTLL